MKIKLCIFTLIFPALLMMFAAATQAQSKKTKKTKIDQEIWQTINWEKWGLAYSIPSELLLESETPKSNPTRPDGYFGDTRFYERSRRGGKETLPRFELMVDITNWKGETVKTDYRDKEIELTPEELLKLDYIGDERQLQNPESPVLEAGYLEIDGLKGVFVTANSNYSDGKTVKPANAARVIWMTYRIFNGNVQRIMTSVDGQRKDLEKMKKIINSQKFSK